MKSLANLIKNWMDVREWDGLGYSLDQMRFAIRKHSGAKPTRENLAILRSEFNVFFVVNAANSVAKAIHGINEMKNEFTH